MDGVTILQVITNTYLPDWAEALQLLALIAGAILQSYIVLQSDSCHGRKVKFDSIKNKYS